MCVRRVALNIAWALINPQPLLWLLRDPLVWPLYLPPVDSPWFTAFLEPWRSFCPPTSQLYFHPRTPEPAVSWTWNPFPSPIPLSLCKTDAFCSCRSQLGCDFWKHLYLTTSPEVPPIPCPPGPPYHIFRFCPLDSTCHHVNYVIYLQTCLPVFSRISIHEKNLYLNGLLPLWAQSLAYCLEL